MILPLFLISHNFDQNGIFAKSYKDNIFTIHVSGSSKQNINNTMQVTKPEYAIEPRDKRYDWCPNCFYNYEGLPYMILSMKSMKFRFNGYFIRVGCCFEDGCCCNDVYGCFDSCLYSWALQISNDNKTWKDVHTVSKNNDMRKCTEKTYQLDAEYTAKFVRIIQTETCPGLPLCMALNRIELFGDTVPFSDDSNDEFASYHDDDNDVSIIGHISKR